MFLLGQLGAGRWAAPAAGPGLEPQGAVGWAEKETNLGCASGVEGGRGGVEPGLPLGLQG